MPCQWRFRRWIHLRGSKKQSWRWWRHPAALTLEQPTLFMSVSELHSTTLPKFFFSQSNREMFISKAFFAIPLCNKHFNVNILHLFENDAFLCFRILHRSNFVDNVGGTWNLLSTKISLHDYGHTFSLFFLSPYIHNNRFACYN